MDLASLIQIEKASRARPELALPVRDAVLALLPHDHWVVRMHVARLLPRLGLLDHDRQEAIRFLLDQAESGNKFVTAWALDSLSQFAIEDHTIRPRVEALLEAAMLSISPAIRVRAKKGLERLDAAPLGRIDSSASTTTRSRAPRRR